MKVPQPVVELETKLITTDILGKAMIPDLSYMNCDGSYLKIDTDYLNVERSKSNPSPGPFEKIKEGIVNFKVR
jgi:alpha-N-arabinofuranosidase